ERERVGEPLHERRYALLALDHLRHGDAEPLRNGINQRVVDELPAECSRNPGGKLGTSCADHSRNGDQRHVEGVQSAKMTDAEVLDDLKAERVPDGVGGFVLDG